MNLSVLGSMGNLFSNTEAMPVLFLGHGSPMNAIEENEFVAGFRKTGTIIPRPNAIVCVSAHWETNGTKVTSMAVPGTIHDFGGFPEALYAVQYPAPGSPELALEIKNSVKNTVIGLDDQWGLDHGCWSVVKHLYPDADVPVIQISLDYRKSPDEHYKLGKELSFLRRKGVLVVGSGNLVHNLRLVAWNRLHEPGYGFDWAFEAGNQLKRLILDGNDPSLINYQSLGKEVNMAVPTPEHFLPLLYVLALREGDDNVSLFNDKAVGGSLTMTSVMIGK